jgi:hypothetical protein
VRIDTLARNHPLEGDIVRLEAARRRFLMLLPEGSEVAGTRESELIDPYGLPALTVATTVHSDENAVEDVISHARDRSRARLREIAAMHLATFVQGMDFRQQQLIARRRVELEGAGRKDQDREAREIRDRVAADVWTQVGQRAPELLNRQLPVAVLSVELSPSQEFYLPAATAEDPNPPSVVIMPPVPDKADLDADISRLESDPAADGVSTRARFTYKLLQARARLAEVKAQIDAIVDAGTKDADAQVLALQEQRLAAIEDELESLRSDEEGRFVVRAQRAALERALSDEAAVSSEALALSGAGANRLPNGAGAEPFSSLFGVQSAASAVGVGRSLGIRRAIERIDAQRARLQRFIDADVSDAVRDAASVRGVDVVLAPAAGRRDMTAEFARWCGLSSIPIGTASKTAGAGGKPA